MSSCSCCTTTSTTITTTTCSPGSPDCPPSGACCYGINQRSCVYTDKDTCTNTYDGYFNKGVSCEDDPCESGRCCILPNYTSSPARSGNCPSLEGPSDLNCIGVWQVLGVNCGPCSNIEGLCLITTETDCRERNGGIVKHPENNGKVTYPSGSFMYGELSCKKGTRDSGASACDFGSCCTQVELEDGSLLHAVTTFEDCSGFPGYSFKDGAVSTQDSEGLICDHIITTGVNQVTAQKACRCCDTCTCFVENSQVLMPDGSYKNIQDVKIGEQVQSTGGVNTVRDIERTILGERKLASINGSEFFFSEDHPLLTTDGLKAVNYEMSKKLYEDLDLVGQIETGDEILTPDGKILVENIEVKVEDFDTKLYDLSLDGNHIYFVKILLFITVSVSVTAFQQQAILIQASTSV